MWVAPNRSKHIAERTISLIERLAAHGLPRDLADLSAQVQLDSLRGAVRAAMRDGVPIGQELRVGGWQLEFRAPREAGQLPALIHAIPLEYVGR